MELTVTERVLNGVEWLNSVLPGISWWEEVNPLCLNISSLELCVLGQLGHLLTDDPYADFDSVIWKYRSMHPFYNGFVTNEEGLAELQNEWVQMITNLRELSGSDLIGAAPPATMTGVNNVEEPSV